MPAGRGRRIAGLVVGIVVSVALLWWSMRGLRLADVLHHIRSAPPAPILLAVVVATLTFPMRAARWRLLLQDGGAPLSWRAAWHAIAVGYAANNTLPFRAGELLRAYVATRLAPVRLSAAIASVAVERVFDALTLIATFGAALLLSGLPATTAMGGVALPALAQRVGIFAALAFIIAAIVLVRTEAVARLITKLVPWPGVSRRLVALLTGVRDGLSALRSPGRLALVIAWCAAIWLVNAYSFQALFPAFGIHAGYAAAVLVQSAVVFGIAVPSSPGYVGVFEAAIVVALGLYGVPHDQALAYAITYHAATFLPITLLGVYSALRSGLHRAPESTEHRA